MWWNTHITYILDTDASLFGVGAVLSQVDETGTGHVIAYGSKTLSKTQRNYCTTMRELLAAVVLVRQFHHYLWGRHFILRTGHASLMWLVNFKESDGMLARWLSVLTTYDCKVKHRNGTLHSNADGLSRMPLRKCKREDCEECALKVSECVCVVTRSQGKVNHETQGDRTLVSTNEFSGDSSMLTRTGLGGSLDFGVMHNESTQSEAGCTYRSANDFNCRTSTAKNKDFHRSNWTDRWSLDKLR